MIKKETDIINRNLPEKRSFSEIQSYVDAIEKNPEPYQEKNFDQRAEVIDVIEFHILGQIEDLLLKTDQPNKLISLKYRAEKIKNELEEIDTNLFKKLRANIQSGGYAGKKFKNLINEYVEFNVDDIKHQEEPGYDNLDVFINGLTHLQAIPEQTKDLEPEMVYYQKTPARIIFELIEKVHFNQEDVFFDLGSGLGQVAILVNLLAGIKAKGIEFETAFCGYARGCATGLNLSRVTFINEDARKADYSDGTIFFMFTPFKGEIMQEVLEALRKESLQRKIKIITYGPCTAQVALQSWLDLAVPQDDNIYKLAIFTSL